MPSPPSISPGRRWRIRKALPALEWPCSPKVKTAEVLLKIVLKFHVVQVKSSFLYGKRVICHEIKLCSHSKMNLHHLSMPRLITNDLHSESISE